MRVCIQAAAVQHGGCRAPGESWPRLKPDGTMPQLGNCPLLDTRQFIALLTVIQEVNRLTAAGMCPQRLWHLCQLSVGSTAAASLSCGNAFLCVLSSSSAPYSCRSFFFGFFSCLLSLAIKPDQLILWAEVCRILVQMVHINLREFFFPQPGARLQISRSHSAWEL